MLSLTDGVASSDGHYHTPTTSGQHRQRMLQGRCHGLRVRPYNTRLIPLNIDLALHHSRGTLHIEFSSQNQPQFQNNQSEQDSEDNHIDRTQNSYRQHSHRMGLFSSSKKSGVSFGHDDDDHNSHQSARRSSTRRSSFARRERDHEREQRVHLEREFRITNPYHRSGPQYQQGFVEDEEHDRPHRGRRSRRESHDPSRSRRAGAPSLSPSRATYENQNHRSAYRQRSSTRHEGVSGFFSNPHGAGARRSSRQRSASPGRVQQPSHHRSHRRHRDADDGGLAERLAGFSLGGEERRHGRRRPSYTSRIQRIYELD